MSTEDEINRVVKLLALWVEEIRLSNAIDFYNINQVAENVAAKLLNLIYNYQLKNLNQEKKHFPGIDLGDKFNQIAFQVTSRKDPKKIEENLVIYVEKYRVCFPNGIRFLILNHEKPRLSPKKKEKYAKICPGFVPDRDILTDKELMVDIEKIYHEDKTKFQEIAQYLEDEFAHGGTRDCLRALLKGSKNFYDNLRGPNGRFKNLSISDLILTHTENHWFKTEAIIDSTVAGATTNRTTLVADALSLLWPQEIKHAVILGDGGMGKTVSLIQWWQQLLENKDTNSPVPVYIALNEYNQLPEGKRDNFIVSYIRKNYGYEYITLEQFEKAAGCRFYIFLLDGFNEITVEKRELLLELNRLKEQCPGIQLVMTSRYDMRGLCNWSDWNLVRLLPLTDEQVDGYLAKETQLQDHLRELVKNPMMLTLYAVTCEVQKNHKESKLCQFKEQVETPAELLWNFIEAQVAKLPERLGHDEEQIYYYKFLLKFLLPALGFEMEKVGLFDFTSEQLNDYLDIICKRFSTDDFLSTFPEFVRHVDVLPMGGCADFKDRLKRNVELKEILSNTLSMLVMEGNSFRFLHQNFRDFFAAVFVRNELEISLKKRETPWVLKERTLNFFVRRMVGELEGEHRVKPYVVDGVGWQIKINKENHLHRVVDLCRGKFGDKDLELVGYTVWNIVTIWKEVRGELSGADLSHLDLSGVLLNGVECSRFYKNQYLAASFAGARVHEKNILHQGHTSRVNSAVYSADGGKILSASYDGTIKEWDAVTGECIHTFSGHNLSVSSVVYSSDEKKILSASFDHAIKEWDTTTKECVQTLSGHTGFVYNAVYSSDGEKILSSSEDKTIKEWKTATGECVNTFKGHNSNVISAFYRNDEKKILSASWDNTIREWDAKTGECFQTLIGHAGFVISAVYSNGGKNILSVSEDKTIKEWDSTSGACIQTLSGHEDTVLSAIYSCDGKRILSASSDNTIREWNAKTGECIRILEGHKETVSSAIYRGDGKRILSASHDYTIKEWDTTTGECVQTLEGHADYVRRSIYSMDRKTILLALEDHTIQEWDATILECVRTLKGHTRPVNSALYSSDGKRILSASEDHTIKEWDATTGECIQTLKGHSCAVNKAVYFDCGKKIRSESFNLILKEWDATTGDCLKTYDNNENSSMLEYPPYPKNIKLSLSSRNKVLIPNVDIQGETRELINVSGLFIHGCSFENLEKGSQWTMEGLEILRTYRGKI